ncbi:MAG: EAL domain-containing protein [Tindallia sp. MSAO_Bac2]|nr:MAG: EAL domain-containing protein [Tindallia sp. MSAO_Bac2]
MALENKMPNTDYREFARILNQGKIHTLFQPIASLKNGQILGYEALSRGPEDSRFYRPDFLFEFAHRTGEVWKLDLLCREKAIENGRQFAGKQKLFINIDPLSIRDPDFQRGFTKQKLKQFQLDCSDIVMEITEKTAIEDYAAFNSMLNSYREQGYPIAIDDAGSGYSGLRTVAETRPEYIKIDMELVRNIDKDMLKLELLKSIRAFSSSAGIKLIAEGIETIDECRKLMEVGVDYGQGFWLGKPEREPKNIPEKIISIITRWHQSRDRIDKHHDVLRAKELVRQDEALSVKSTVKEARDLFSNNNHLQGIAVTQDNKPVGLVMRNRFDIQQNNADDPDSFLNKRICEVMKEQPMIIHDNMPVRELALMAVTRREEDIYDYILVTQEDKYMGIVSIASVLETMSLYI